MRGRGGVRRARQRVMDSGGSGWRGRWWRASDGATAATRERMTRMFFEEFNVAGLAFVDSAVCAVYASGRVSGVSVDVAEQGTDGVRDGRPTTTATARRIEVGGRAMDEALMRCVKSNASIWTPMSRRSSGESSGSVRPRARKLARGCPVECEQETFKMRMDPC